MGPLRGVRYCIPAFSEAGHAWIRHRKPAAAPRSTCNQNRWRFGPRAPQKQQQPDSQTPKPNQVPDIYVTTKRTISSPMLTMWERNVHPLPCGAVTKPSVRKAAASKPGYFTCFLWCGLTLRISGACRSNCPGCHLPPLAESHFEARIGIDVAVWQEALRWHGSIGFL